MVLKFCSEDNCTEIWDQLCALMPCALIDTRHNSTGLLEEEVKYYPSGVKSNEETQKQKTLPLRLNNKQNIAGILLSASTSKCNGIKACQKRLLYIAPK